MIVFALAMQDAVDLVLPGERTLSVSAGGVTWLAIAAAGVLVLAAGVVWWLTLPADPVEQAFVRVSRELALGRAHRRLLGELAGAVGAPGPMPLLLSAAARARAAETLGVPPEQMVELERRIPPL